MARSSSTILIAALLLAAPSLGGCNRELTCSSEVTAGSGIFRGTAIGKRPEADLRRAAVRAACGQLCTAGGQTGAEGDLCVVRCSVDVESAKVGARTTCTKGGAR